MRPPREGWIRLFDESCTNAFRQCEELCTNARLLDESCTNALSFTLHE